MSGVREGVGGVVAESVAADERNAGGAGGPLPPMAFGPLGKGEHIAVEPDGDGAFHGHCHPGRAAARSYGGASLAQALTAAYRTVDEDRAVHSLHGYFLRALSPQRPVHYAVDRVRDGRSYSMRQVTATQDDKESLTMSVSFKTPQSTAGWRQPGMPDVPGPDGLEEGWAYRPADHPLRNSVHYREVPAPPHPGTGEITRHAWLRTVGALPDDPALHARVLAYISDAPLAPTALRPLGEPRPTGIALASLDHAMWFHRPARADSWLLYTCRSRTAGDGRTFAHGEFWTQEGDLVATVAQEALLHIRG